MEHVGQKLVHLRRTARGLLVVQRIGGWLAIVCAVIAALVLMDFLLRLPGWGRLILGVGFVVGAMGWLVSGMADALGFRPALSSLALRAERLFPQLEGVFATGVDFATQSDHSQGRSAGFMHLSVRDAEARLAGLSLRQLIDPRRTIRMVAAGGGTLLLLFLGAVVFPAEASIAAQRWLQPLGDADWPRWTEVRSDVHETVWPMDEPLRLRAVVEKGYRPNMRTIVHYRLRGAAESGRWHFSLMNDQGRLLRDETSADNHRTRAGRFERIVDLPAMLEGAATVSAQNAVVEFYFEAGDHTTAVQELELVARPAVRQAALTIEPPPYARDVLQTQQIAMDQQTGQRASAAALIGSTVRWQVLLNKPIPVQALHLSEIAPGLPADAALSYGEQDEAMSMSDELVFAFRLDETVQTPLAFYDEHGLGNISERVYRVEAIEDAPPTVTLTQPHADEAVLAGAWIDVAAMAQDDVAVASLALEAKLPGDQMLALTRSQQREARLIVNDELDLAEHDLSSGDVVELHAVAEDVFDLDGRRHDPVRATPRLLRIIDEATLESQIRSDLAALRQQAARMVIQQSELEPSPSAQALSGQQQLHRRLADQSGQVERLDQRMQRNRFNEPTLNELLQQAGRMLDAAQDASRDAITDLQQAQRLEEQQSADAPAQREQARQHQHQARAQLEELVNLLDQGRDIQAVQAKLRDLLQQQRNLAGDTRQMMPRTMGLSLDELDESDRAELQRQAQRERELAEQAGQLVRQMQVAAEAIARQGDQVDSQATAATLRESAAIAQQQGLTQQMQQAAASTQANRLSQAGTEQNTAIGIMEQMLSELQQRDRRRQEMLRRRLAELAEAIEKLIEQQQVQIARLERVADVAALDEPMSVLRRNTLSVEDTARQARETIEVADMLGQAAEAQAQAIAALRTAARQPAAEAEAQALAHLEDALARIREQQRQQEQDQMREQRDALRKAYMRLAEEQGQLLTASAELAQVQLTRRHRAQLNEMAGEQTRIRHEAAELRAQVSDTLMFVHLHDRIDEKAVGVTQALREPRVDARVLGDEAYIVSALQSMAEALAQDEQEDDFASGESGGDGGGQQGETPLIPPVAELKLLRGMQAQVYERTRQVGGDGGRAVEAFMLDELARDQRELPQLAEQLIEKLQSQQSDMPTLEKPQENQP